MRNWKYTLKTGQPLHRAIYSGNLHDVLEMLKVSYRELLQNGLIDEDDYDRYTEDFDLYGYAFDDYDEPEEVADYELNELYDLCDNIGVWIDIG